VCSEAERLTAAGFTHGQQLTDGSLGDITPNTQ
jgi:hypothetical protein